MSLNINGVDNQAMTRSTSENVWDLGAFTVEAYIYITTLNTPGNGQYIWDRGGGDLVGSMNLRLNGSNQIGALVYQTSGASTSVAGATSISANTWYRVAMTWDGTNITVFLNGVSDGTTSGARTIDTTNKATGMGEGQPTASSQIKGLLSDVRFWSTNRSAATQLTDYNKRLNGDEGNLLGYWKLNETSGNTATDATVGARNFTAVSAVWNTTNDPPFLLTPPTLSDRVNITEVITIQTIFPTPPVVDNITISESVDIIRGTARDQSVSDNITVSESVTAIAITANVFDSATIAETTTANLTTTAQVNDSVTIAETVTATSGPLIVNVFDSITASDQASITPSQFISIFDNITVSENITLVYNNWLISVVDSITISESIGIHRVRPTWSTNWTGDVTIPTTKWKKTPN